MSGALRWHVLDIPGLVVLLIDARGDAGCYHACLSYVFVGFETEHVVNFVECAGAAQHKC